MDEKKPMIGTGSLLNSSEGLLSASCLAALTSTLMASSVWQVQAACALGISVLGSVYVYCRSSAKAGEADA